MVAGDLDLSRGDSSLQATTSGEVTVTGEALINNRKNKLISAYELEVTGTWSGELILGCCLAMRQSP